MLYFSVIMGIDDRHRNSNINIREITQLGNQLTCRVLMLDAHRMVLLLHAFTVSTSSSDQCNLPRVRQLIESSCEVRYFQLSTDIAVTTVINLPASGGRREFVYDQPPPALISDTLVTGLSTDALPR